jgi:endonuclease/exonuclease/phosphatase family metal-dependent hydrolase
VNEIVTGNFTTRRWELRPYPELRVINWNIERGLQLSKVIDFLGSQNADLLILQEVDLNARRTRRINVAEEIARRLEMNYVFGREFEELTQGTKSSPAYHGQATLSRWNMSNARVLRFRHQSGFWRPRWYLPRTEPFQERKGGRIALVTEIESPRRKLTAYNLHLESRGNRDLRVSQMDEVLLDAAKHAPPSATLVAGDMNFDASVAIRTGAARGLNLRSAIKLPSPPTTPAHGLFQGPRAIDWAFLSGPIESRLGQVHDGIHASDHYPLSFTIRFS